MIPAGLRPILYLVQGRCHGGVSPDYRIQLILQFCQIQQFTKIVRVAVIHLLLFGKVMFSSSLGDAGLEGAFNSIPCQIVCTFGKSGGEQGPGLPEADFANFLKFDTIHALTPFMT